MFEREKTKDRLARELVATRLENKRLKETRPPAAAETPRSGGATPPAADEAWRQKESLLARREEALRQTEAALQKQKAELEAKAKGISAGQALEQGQARVPLGRYADPKDIASVTLFLASEQAAYVTGAVIPMDGGMNPII